MSKNQPATDEIQWTPELTEAEDAQRIEEEDFHLPEIVSEIWRRMREAARARRIAREMDTQAPRGENDPPDLETDDGEGIFGRPNVLDYAAEMKGTADQLIQMAGLAIQTGPVFEDRHPDVDTAIRDAFACVVDIVPTSALRMDDDEPERELPEGLTDEPGAAFPRLGGGNGRHSA